MGVLEMFLLINFFHISGESSILDRNFTYICCVFCISFQIISSSLWLVDQNTKCEMPPIQISQMWTSANFTCIVFC